MGFDVANFDRLANERGETIQAQSIEVDGDIMVGKLKKRKRAEQFEDDQISLANATNSKSRKVSSGV